MQMKRQKNYLMMILLKIKIKETFPNISNLSLKSIANEAFQNKESQKN